MSETLIVRCEPNKTGDVGKAGNSGMRFKAPMEDKEDEKGNSLLEMPIELKGKL